LNNYYLDSEIVINEYINIGFAIDDSENGLKVASISNTNKLSLLDIENEILSLSTKYKEKKLNIEDLTSATFTITDLFNTNVLNFHPLVNFKNSTILGISSYQNNGFIIDVSFDHRITSGKEISNFLNDLKFRLENRLNPGLNIINNKVRKDNNYCCIKCGRENNEDLNANIYFLKVFNSKYDGIICSNCLIGW
jgi:pyruvate/2-oxoglutarate dehydrogenase complex dihydrolipoamide acyltransferase (E2) component